MKRLDCFPRCCTILHSYSSVWGSNFSTSPPTLVFICLLDIAMLVDMMWHLIVTLICMPWKLQALNISPWACWPFVRLLWWNVFLDPLPVSKLGCSLLWSCKSSFNVGRITTNKAGGGNENPAELFQILKDDAVKGLRSICKKMENSAVTTGLENVSFHSNPKERQCQRMLKLLDNCTHFTH